MIIAAVCSATIHAADNQSIQQIDKSVAQLQQSIGATQAEKRELQATLKKIELKLSELNRDIRDHRQKLRELNTSLTKLESQLETQKAEVSSHKAFLRRELLASYAVAQTEPLRLMLSLDEPSSVGRTLTYYRYLHEARAQRINEINQAVAELRATEASINDEKRKQSQEHDQLTEKKAETETVRAERQTLLAKLDQSLSSKQAQLSELLENRERLQRTVTELAKRSPPPTQSTQPTPRSRGSFAAYKGQLMWPAEGRILYGFGQKRGNSNLTWRGILIGAGEGKPVRAVAPGRVVFADWLRGFGLLLIIDHGDGYLSLYGHNDVLLKKVGENVDEGEEVATVGDTGGRLEAGLYFELRHQGKPVDPRRWLKKNG